MRKEPETHRANDSDTAGVIARPPILFVLALLLGRAADRLWPISFPVAEGRADTLMATVLILGGVVAAVGGIRDFFRAATPVPTNQPTRTLVTTGMHGWSRNPIYVGMFLAYCGLGVAANSPWTLILAVPLAITIRYGVVAREEAYLARRFGAAYLDYTARVRRWL